VEPGLADGSERDWVRCDTDLQMWTGPFRMAGINTRVVRRSNALQGWAYGRRFRYREVTGFSTSPAAPLLGGAAAVAQKALEAGLAFGPSRTLLGQLLPAPGQGPGETTRRPGHFRPPIHTPPSRRTCATSRCSQTSKTASSASRANSGRSGRSRPVLAMHKHTAWPPVGSAVVG